MEKVLEKIRYTKIIAAIGVVLLILGTFFTYVKFTFFGFEIGSASLIGYWEGYIVIILALANLLINFKSFAERYIPKLYESKIGNKLANISNPKMSLIPTGIALILLIYLHSTLDIDSDYATYGLGFYLLWLGVILLIAYPFIYKGE